MKRKNGFTLLELLVVIAIITLLMVIILPSLGVARELARKAGCTSRLRNLGLAVQMYANERDEKLPAADPVDRDTLIDGHWFANAALLRYVNVSLVYSGEGTLIGPPANDSGLACPSHENPMCSEEPQGRGYALSYVMNGTWGAGDWCSVVRKHRRLAEFASPCEVLAMADGNNHKSETVGTVLYHGCPKKNFDYRHSDSVNVVFLDSHVVSLEPDDIPLGRNNRFEPFWSEKR